MKSAKVFAPASVGNAAVGFDVLGFALEGIGDTVTVTAIEEPATIVASITDTAGVLGHHNLPLDPARNTAAVALENLRRSCGLDHGFSISLDKGIAVGSGMGGSAASAVGAVVAANALLQSPLTNNELLKFALQGELVASGTAHADNIAPCLFGGLTLTVSMDPLRVVSIPVPDEIVCVLVHPHIRVDTLSSRSMLGPAVALKDYVRQSANLAGFISGCYTHDMDRIRGCFEDVIIEPQRASQIPGFYDVKAAANSNGALGTAIAGAGPSVFAWTTSRAEALRVKDAMASAFKAHGIQKLDAMVSPICSRGARLVG